MGEYEVEKRPPTVAELRGLHEAVDWVDELPAADEVVAAALARSLFAVCTLCDGELVGTARMVGDGGIYFYIQDMIVVPAHQGRGIGQLLMEAVLTFLEETAPANAFIGLMAAEGKAGFYGRFGFGQRTAAGPGMFRMWGR